MADTSGNAKVDRGDVRGQVLAATDIVQLIGQTVSLQRRGRKFVGLCPFHQEKTPSFNVDPGKQAFYCFGCKASGTAFDFVMKRDRVEFIDALKSLAEAAGIELPKYGGSKEKSGEKQALLEAHSAACSLFENLLKDPRVGAPAREYLQKRGFNAEAIKAFQIGYVPDGWDNLLRSPQMRKFAPGMLALAGLVKARTSGDGHYDTFRNRLMFPIRDTEGRIIAFGGRVMPGSEDPAKYLNSPETPLFSKSRCVFGIDLARQRIVETRTVAVVEGYTDVVMAHQYGVSNVVSILGTAMTEQHLQILRRFADRVVLLFDADTAGDAAVDRAVELFLTQPVEIAIATMPEGVDPDEYVMEHGADGFSQLLANAADALTYKWKQVTSRLEGNDDIKARQDAIEEYFRPIAAAVGTDKVDPIRWGAIRLQMERRTGLTADEINRRFRKGKPKSISRQSRSTQAVREVSLDQPGDPFPRNTGPLVAADRAERFILGILLNDPTQWQRVQQHVHPGQFTDPGRKKLAERYWDHQRNEGEPVFSEFLSLLDSESLKQLAMELADEAEQLPEPQTMLDDSVRHLEEFRQRNATDRLVAEAKKEVDELDLFRRLSDHKKQPDLRRVL